MTLIANIDTPVPPTPGGKYSVSIASFLRKNATDTYSALDVVGQNTSAAIEFPNCSRSGSILGATMSYAGTDDDEFRLWVFDIEPTNHADNAALALVTADMFAIVGHWDFLDTDKLLVGTLQTHYTASGVTTAANEESRRIPYTNGTGSLYGLLQAVTGFTTPVASARINIRLMLEHD